MGKQCLKKHKVWVHKGKIMTSYWLLLVDKTSWRKCYRTFSTELPHSSPLPAVKVTAKVQSTGPSGS